jgi:hypothetical protein
LPTSITGRYVTAVSFAATTAGATITATLANINSQVNGSTVIWDSTCNASGNSWSVGGGVPTKFYPKG